MMFQNHETLDLGLNFYELSYDSEIYSFTRLGSSRPTKFFQWWQISFSWSFNWNNDLHDLVLLLLMCLESWHVWSLLAFFYSFHGDSSTRFQWRCDIRLDSLYAFEARANFIQSALGQLFPSFFEWSGLQRWHSSVGCACKLGIRTQRSSLSTSPSHKWQSLCIICMQSAHPASLSSWSEETLSWPIALWGYGAFCVMKWSLWEESLLVWSKFFGYTVAMCLSSSCHHVREV